MKKLELEEHDRQRRRNKTFSEMMEERGNRGRKLSISLAMYNDEDANDLSDLGIGTSSGKSSVSGDTHDDTHSVLVCIYSNTHIYIRVNSLLLKNSISNSVKSIDINFTTRKIYFFNCLSIYIFFTYFKQINEISSNYHHINHLPMTVVCSYISLYVIICYLQTFIWF